MKHRPNLLHNIGALAAVQAVGYLVPLITLPYVTRVLGVEAWGLAAWAQLILTYFAMLTNWGFSFSGTRKVAALREDQTQLTDIFSSIWTAQCLLCIAAVALLVAVAFAVPALNAARDYFLAGTTIIIGTVLFPIWFLNGLERMKEVAALQILVRVSAVPLIFLLVKGPEDGPLLLAITGLTTIVAGLLSIYWISVNLNVRWQPPSPQNVLAELKEGASLFGSTVTIGLYTTLIPVVLGFIAGPAAVGYYSLADRLRQLAQNSLQPISQALFPRLSHLFATDKSSAMQLLLKSSKLLVLVSAAGSLALFALAEPIVLLLAGEEFRPAIPILRWIAPLILIVSLSNIFGVQIMLPNQKVLPFNAILGAAAVLSLALLIPLIRWLGGEGAAICALVVETFVTVAMANYLWKSGFFTQTRDWKTNEV